MEGEGGDNLIEAAIRDKKGGVMKITETKRGGSSGREFWEQMSVLLMVSCLAD